MQGDTLLHTPQNVQARFLTADWAAAFRTQPDEFDYWIYDVEGTIPEFLRGSLFRNGPGNFGAFASSDLERHCVVSIFYALANDSTAEITAMPIVPCLKWAIMSRIGVLMCLLWSVKTS